MDVLVKWDKDDSENIVARSDLKVIGGGRLANESRVKMWWADGKWWKGTVLSIKRREETCVQSDSDDDDDITLASLIRSEAKKTAIQNESFNDPPLECLMDADESAVAAAADALNSSSVLADLIEYEEEKSDKEHRLLDVPSSAERINMIQQSVQNIRTDSESDQSEYDDTEKDPDYNPSPNDKDMQQEDIIQDNPTAQAFNEHMTTTEQQPEAYEVEGEPRAQLVEPPKKKSKRCLVKEGRVQGTAYITEKSNKAVQARNILKSKCEGHICAQKGFSCYEIDDDQRQAIINCFYGLGSLMEQRQWISRHIRTEQLQNAAVSRKTKRIEYYLPRTSDQKNSVAQVCRIMFLNTLNIAERQIRTVIDKTTATGDLGKENRGGRPVIQKSRDANIKELVVEHINRFPRAESHYCRADTNLQYLSNELNLTIMHRMYQESHIQQNRVSFAYYLRCFKK